MIKSDFVEKVARTCSMWCTYFDGSFCSLNDGVEWHVFCLQYLYIQSHRNSDVDMHIMLWDDWMIV